MTRHSVAGAAQPASGLRGESDAAASPALEASAACVRVHHGESQIPAVAHFIWLGARFPWVNVLAIRSALERGGFERVVLHHEPGLASCGQLRDLARDTRFEARPCDPASTLGELGVTGTALSALYAELRSPAARANVLRAAILAREGGVYLDMDTVTLRPLSPLLQAGVFCGEEEIAFPAAKLSASAPFALVRALGLHALRAFCKHSARGIELFRRVDGWYARAVNNAVLGARPQHPFVLSLLTDMLELAPRRRRRRFALGTHLLQRRVARGATPELVIHPPQVFYPLGPELSHHWFRLRERVSLERVISTETRVVHWYASVENRALAESIVPDYVRRHARRQLFSALAEPFA
jgi:hypothetical protein